MALLDSNTYDIYDKLKYNFLFNNDINCIHILLNLYDLENNINNIVPNYISINNLRKNISKLLNDRRGNHLIAYNLGELIHEEINRLELYLYLEGYKYGFLNNKNANQLEDITIKYYSIPDLYNMKYLFHFNIKEEEIVEFKNIFLDNVGKVEKASKRLYNIILEYVSIIIKPKIYSLNKHLDKQLSIDIGNDGANIKEDETLLTIDELKIIYNEVLRIILKDGQKIYQNASWNGLNDRVLKRYR
ncbi:MAG: hypothetical protein RIN55_03180 [Tissierellaceae bacterium]|nr:hypothetical protein [Tissierellaceae bacterium]